MSRVAHRIAQFGAFWAICAFAVPALPDVRGQDDKAKLDGTWKVVIAMGGGRPTNEAIGEFAVFRNGVAEELDAHGRRRHRQTATMATDESKTPAYIDLTFDDGTMEKGVFVLRGDSLEICWGGETRPASLDSSRSKDLFYLQFERIKMK